MGRVHLDAMRSSTQLTVAGVVEPLPARRDQLAAEGLHVYASVGALLDADPPEAVLIAAPSDQHAVLVNKFAANGIPVMCEKPLGVQVEQSVETARAAEQAGVVLQVGYWRRFVPELRRLRERIRSGELGDISQLSCMQWDHRLPSEEFRAHSGGIAVDMGVHEFDQTRWLLGQEFEWVTAGGAGPSSAPRAPADPDCATLLAQLSGGATVTISLGRHFPHADSCWLEVWGTRGYERLPFMCDAAGEKVFRDSMLHQAEAFVGAVRGSEQRGAAGADAVAALTVARMAGDSLAEGGIQVRREAGTPV
jgi:myo-inositol 2-dehydrogenase/D-chiro-inositol 1-dehydrogenase